MTTKWHYNVIASASSKALAHLPAAVGTETGWLPAASLYQAKRVSLRVAHAFAQLSGDVAFQGGWRKQSDDRLEASSPCGQIHIIVARAGTMAGETMTTMNYRKGPAHV